MKRYISPTCDVGDLEWVWSCLTGEHITKVQVWTQGGKIAQLQLTGSRGTELKPLSATSTPILDQGTSLVSEKGFSTLQVSTAPRYAWKLFLAGVEVYEVTLHAKRKTAATTPANVLKLFTPQGSRLVGLGFGFDKSGMLVAVGCEESVGGGGGIGGSSVGSGGVAASATPTPSRTLTTNMIDVTAESVLFLTDAVIVFSLAVACLLAVYHWCARGKRCASITQAV